MLPDKIEVDASKEHLGVTAEYIRKLKKMRLEDVGSILFLGDRAIARREQEGIGLQRLTDIFSHFEALGYEMHITLTRKEKTRDDTQFKIDSGVPYRHEYAGTGSRVRRDKRNGG